MLEATMIQRAAPTIAGLKVGSLYPYFPEKDEDIFPLLEHCNRKLASKGLRTVVIGYCPSLPSRVLLYTYRPKLLRRLLEQASVRDFLSDYGYEASDSVGDYLEHLSSRLCPEHPFPHEIGVFLGYPLNDVIGFIDNEGKNSLCCGFWKVYGCREEAERQFKRFHRCEQIYSKCLACGKTLSELTVAV